MQHFFLMLIDNRQSSRGITTVNKKSVCALGLASCLVAAGANAGALTRTAIDVTAGAIGATAGGPVGLVAGVAAGEYLSGAHSSDNLDTATTDNSIPATKITEVSTTELDELRRRLAASEYEAKAFRDISMKAASFDVMFTTSSNEINANDMERLALLPPILKEYPELSVRLSGFADPRGNPTYNQQLSERRMASVKTYLMNAGVSEIQIHGKAFGVKNDTNKSRDTYARDRVVTVNLLDTNKNTI